MMRIDELQAIIRDVPDFPKKGIIFKDITTLLKDPRAFHDAVDTLIAAVRNKDFDLVIGIESRGFIFGSLIAYKLGKGFVPVRKRGKLPAQKKCITYSLEYGEDTLEIHEDAIHNGTNVLIADDLLATGGTAQAVAALVESLGGTVTSLAFLIELDFLKGRDKLTQYDIVSLLHFS